MPVYSFGLESPLKFHISNRLAEYYNEAVEEWFKAQTRFNQKFGRRWDPKKDPISIKWSRKQKQAWNHFAAIYKATLEKDGPFHVNDLADDFLVKNSTKDLVDLVRSGTGEELAGMASLTFTRSMWYITSATGIGALYVLLRGLQGYSRATK